MIFLLHDKIDFISYRLKNHSIHIMKQLNGHISQIIGPVIDVSFDLPENNGTTLPAINDALSFTTIWCQQTTKWTQVWFSNKIK